MARFAFRMRIRPELLDEYLARHTEVWPEMLDALRAAGWRDYPLVHDGEGTAFGCFTCEDVEHALGAIDATEIAARWSADMERYFEPGTVAGSDRLVEYFHLD